MRPRTPGSTTTFAEPRVGAGNVAVDRAVLLAAQAECPCGSAFVRTLTPLAARSLIGGLCDVCGTTTCFAPAA